MLNLRPIEIFLIEFIIYIILWLSNDYIATLVTLIFTSILICVLIVALIAEILERSKVPPWYFSFMIASILAPIIAAGIFIGFYGVDLEWMKG